MEFKLPDIGEGLTEGEITRWLVKEGDRVKEGDPMVEVMTDKATVEITAPATGVIAKLHAAEGATVPVHSVLVTIDESGAPAAAPAQATAARAAAAAPAPAARAASGGNGAPAGKVLATPATRKHARELGVEIGRIAGTGPRGRVTKADVEAFAHSTPAASPPSLRAGPPAPAPAETPAERRTLPRTEGTAYPSLAPAPGQLERRVPLRGLRKRIAEHLVHSKHTAPHFTYVERLDYTELVKLRHEAKAMAEAQGVKLTYLPFVIKALIAGFRAFPMLNASLDDARGEVVYKGYYNLGIATDTPEGLMVPVVKGCDRRGILDLAREIARVTGDARAGRAKIEDLRDSTFTITSAGSIGGVLATPIINHPDVAILGINRIEPTPVVRDGQIVIRDICHFSLSLDHRVVDGAQAAYFMNHVKRLLEDPKLLLLESL